jgi:hypothetical protein
MMNQAYMYPKIDVPDTHLYPMHTCIRRTHVSDTHLYPTPTCPRHTHASQHAFTQHTHVILIQQTSNILTLSIVTTLSASKHSVTVHQ